MRNELKYMRWAGVAGLAGALLFFCGDMLLNGHWGAGSTFREAALKMLHESSPRRLFIGGLLGPVAGGLCVLGFWHVRQNLVGRSPMVGRIVFFALSALLRCGETCSTAPRAKAATSLTARRFWRRKCPSIESGRGDHLPRVPSGSLRFSIVFSQRAVFFSSAVRTRAAQTNAVAGIVATVFCLLTAWA
jgi:hypothetical protein